MSKPAKTACNLRFEEGVYSMDSWHEFHALLEFGRYQLANGLQMFETFKILV